MDYDVETKADRMAATRNRINGGNIKIGTAGMGTVLATIPLSNPAGTVSGVLLTLSGAPLSDPSADNSGTAAAAIIEDPGGTPRVIDLTVGTTGTDIVLQSTTITAGQPVILTSASITHA